MGRRQVCAAAGLHGLPHGCCKAEDEQLPETVLAACTIALYIASLKLLG